MDYDCDCCSPAPQSDEQKTKNYLNSRRSDAYYNKLREAEKTFHINEDPAPKTPKELADRLAAGQYTIRDAQEDNKDKWYGSIKSHIEWRDPKTPADKAGYAAFEVLLDKQNILAQDAIMVKTPADGLAALQAFEAWTQ